jgi:UDP-N-acetylmuramoyl-tripeptide--D-alanyl-D-alanine ligase
MALLRRARLEWPRLLAVISYRYWPILLRAATLYRRVIVRNTRAVVVVGSYGKSTTTRAVTRALGRKVHRHAIVNAEHQVARAVLRIRPWDRHAVIEVGIAVPGQMAIHAGLTRPDVTVVTSIGSEHNRSLKTLESTRNEKADMVRVLRPSGIAVLNGDDPNVLWMRSQTRARVITFGFAESNDVRASDVVLNWPTGMRFTVHAGNQKCPIQTRLLGKHMAYPILAAVAVALTEGFTMDEIAPALDNLAPTPGRMETVGLANGAILVRDDFKSGFETIQAALDALAEVPARRRTVILGEVTEPPGSEGPIYRDLGARLARAASRAIFIGRTNAWRPLANGAKSAGLPADALIHVESVRRALAALPEDLGPHDVVLVKGRDTQRLGRVTLALTGRTVGCDIIVCNARVGCGSCPMLERGSSDVPSRHPSRHGIQEAG